MTALDANTFRDLETRHAHLLHRSFKQRFGGLMVLGGILLYCIYSAWFFDLPKLVAEGHWERLGIYLRQWISYDVQPVFRIGSDGKIATRYPRFNPLGDDPKPDWVRANSDGSVLVEVSGSKSVRIAPTQVDVTAYGMTTPVRLVGENAKVDGALPGWMSAYEDTISVDLGFSGDVSISGDQVKVRKRFLGWPNFIFDTHSPFFDKPFGEVLQLIVSGERLDKSQSNLSLAFDNFWNNSAWQHGDIWVKLFQTIVMAFLGTLLGAVFAFPTAFLAARNMTSSSLVNQVVKRFFDFLRSVDMLIWALFLTRAFGPGPLAGSGAIFLTEWGTLGKLYAEGLENVDNKPREGIQSTGASTVLTHRYGVMPQVMPVIVGQTLYQWESNVRGATIIGAVGAGGIGLKLWEAMRTNANWANVCYMVLLILVVVFLFDMASSALRSRLIGDRSR
ncbi:phosphonate ABC transporter, permease protein PhnE [Rhizobium oryzicola]|uniref:Phosphonate ABC transporter, permease protein PhnE n=1 Tax=Rhizobium oryzicola TaxID=1232668 RepID=A0ABT8T2N2_9HYPH|nr:phosphonate ABC transporter, permease protein PhnE [Rhizobium oryzicola]MDO1584152.1 phosphonate ABC transporter, permease protein PhnE [Rhizobium oryzicola]